MSCEFFYSSTVPFFVPRLKDRELREREVPRVLNPLFGCSGSIFMCEDKERIPSTLVYEVKWPLNKNYKIKIYEMKMIIFVSKIKYKKESSKKRGKKEKE